MASLLTANLVQTFNDLVKLSNERSWVLRHARWLGDSKLLPPPIYTQRCIYTHVYGMNSLEEQKWLTRSLSFLVLTSRQHWNGSKTKRKLFAPSYEWYVSSPSSKVKTLLGGLFCGFFMFQSLGCTRNLITFTKHTNVYLSNKSYIFFLSFLYTDGALFPVCRPMCSPLFLWSITHRPLGSA